MNTNPSGERLHALDAVRGFALLLGIVLHGCMSFMPSLAGSGYPIADQSQSVFLEIVFFVIHVFRMATFFLIAGFFARLVFHRRGTKMFIKDRSKRILVPMLALYIPVAAAVTGVFIWAVYKFYGTLTPDGIPQSPVAGTQALPFPLMHFWFLYILIWLYVLSLAGRWLIVKLDAQEGLRRRIDGIYAKLLSSYVAAPLLALPIALAFYLKRDWLWAGGVPTPDQGLVPIWTSLFIYGYVFTLGWILERQRHLLQGIRRSTWVNLAVGAIAVIACFMILGENTEFLSTPDPGRHLPYAISYAIALVALTLAFIGGGMMLFSHESPLIRYLADSSYWLYVLHLPIVFGLQTWMMDMPMHWSIKFPLLIILTCVPLVLTYHWFVRSTWIGSIMNGRKYPRERPSFKAGRAR
jgi:hypothetical protein